LFFSQPTPSLFSQLVFDCLDEPELLDDPRALQEYDARRSELEAASRAPWEAALALAAAGKRRLRRAK